MSKRRKAGFIGKREAKRLNAIYAAQRMEWRRTHPLGRVEVTEGPPSMGACAPKPEGGE